jgi:hypothetical protein
LSGGFFRLDVGQANIVGLAVGVGFDVMAAAVIAAIDQHVADAGCAHFAEGDFLQASRQERSRSRNSAHVIGSA